MTFVSPVPGKALSSSCTIVSKLDPNAGHEVPGVVAVLCEWLGGVGEVNMD